MRRIQPLSVALMIEFGSPTQFAAVSGLPLSTAHNVFTGRRELSTATVETVAQALHVSLADVLRMRLADRAQRLGAVVELAEGEVAW